MKRVISYILVIACLAPGATAGPVSILVEPSSAQTTPGSTVSFLFLIRETEPTPVFAYSLGVDVVAEAGASGAVAANIDLTNFFDAQNLITAGGVTSWSKLVRSGSTRVSAGSITSPPPAHSPNSVDRHSTC